MKKLTVSIFINGIKQASIKLTKDEAQKLFQKYISIVNEKSQKPWIVSAEDIMYVFRPEYVTHLEFRSSKGEGIGFDASPQS